MWRRVRWLPIGAILWPLVGFVLVIADVIVPEAGVIAALYGVILAILSLGSGE